MFKKIFSNQSNFIKNKTGFTMIELMVVVVVTTVITAMAFTYIKGDDTDDVDSATAQLLSDLRWTRNLAASHKAYDFGSGPVYPPGGYGIAFDGDNEYVIFAESGTGVNPEEYNASEDGIIKTVTLENTLKVHEDGFENFDDKYFTFKSADEVVTNLSADSFGRFEMAVNYNPGFSSGEEGYKSIISLGERAADGTILASLGVGFDGYQPGCSQQTEFCNSSADCCTFPEVLTCSDDIATAGTCVAPPPDTGGGGNTSCFPAGTKVTMADGSYKNIEDVQVGDFVLSYDEESGREVSSEVLELVTPIRDHMCELIFADSDIQLTSEHPVYTKEGWKAISPSETARENHDLIVEQLMLGDEVFFEDKSYKEITEINCWQTEIQTYNLKEVKDSNTFFADNILVHNLVGPGCGDITDPVTDTKSAAS